MSTRRRDTNRARRSIPCCTCCMDPAIPSRVVTVGRANLILDNLIAAGKAKPMIIVMPYGRPQQAVTLAPSPVRPPAAGNGFENDLLQDVIPFVEKLYRVSAKPDHRAIAGLSMGGGQALQVGLGHLDTFHSVGAFSAGGRSQNYEERTRACLPTRGEQQEPEAVLHRLWQGGSPVPRIAGLARGSRQAPDQAYVRGFRKRDTCGATGKTTWRSLRRSCFDRGKSGHRSRRSRFGRR